MTQEDVSKDRIVNRLKRIEGQVRGIQRMIEDSRDCESILTQMVAVRAAIDGVGALVLNNYMKLCFRDEAKTEADRVNSLARAVAIWGGVRVGDAP